jgi:putative transposase
MTSKPVALLMADLGVTKTHSRPHVSDDNPYSESQFKTLKYRPEFPERFGSIEDARAFWPDVLCLVQPRASSQRDRLADPGDAALRHGWEVIEQRQQVLDAAYARNPERFTHARPKHPPQPTAVWINPPIPATATEEIYTKLSRHLSQTR